MHIFGVVSHEEASVGPESGRREAVGHVAYRLASELSLAALLVVLLVVFSALRPDSFFTVANYKGIGVNQIVVVFAAIGLLAPLIVGELDLSIGYVIGLSQALVIGLMSHQGLGVPVAIVVTLVACILVGLVNGILVVRLGINSLITTLAIGSILYGVVLWYTGGEVIFENVPQSFQSIATDEFLSLPLAIWYGLALLVVFELLLGFKPTGRRMYVIGGNRRSAQLVGIRVHVIIVGAFAAAALVSGMGGIIIASRLGSAQPELGPQFLLPAYAAAFLGATIIRPGRFNPLGTVIAVYLVAVIVAGLQNLGVPSWAEYMVDGAALVVGVALANWFVKLREERARRYQLRAFEESAREVTHPAEPVATGMASGFDAQRKADDRQVGGQ
jgi:ribose transport system permease protein